MKVCTSGITLPSNPQCGKDHFLVQKLQILEKLEKWFIFIFVPKLTIFSGKKSNRFEFSCVNWSKIDQIQYFVCLTLGQNLAIFGLKVSIFDTFYNPNQMICKISSKFNF